MTVYRTPNDPRPRLPMLDRIAIKTPCSANWDEMVGEGAVRHCHACRKDVYDVSAMTADEAETFLANHVSDGVCARIFRRPDGRILTSECDAGIARRHMRKAAKVLATSLTASALAIAAVDQATLPTLSEEPPEWTYGDVYSTSPPLLKMSLGAVAEIGEVDSNPIVHIDEAALAESSDPESEILGTSAKTARVVANRRAKADVLLSGKAALVTAGRQRVLGRGDL